MSKRRKTAPRGREKLQVLTTESLQADKAASIAREKARYAKAKLKALKKELRAAKVALKAARKAARAAAREAKRTHKALETCLDRIAKHKKKQQARSMSGKRRGMSTAAAGRGQISHLPSTAVSGNSGQ